MLELAEQTCFSRSIGQHVGAEKFPLSVSRVRITAAIAAIDEAA